MILRRNFITLLGGAAAWPLAAWAQPGDRVRRIGVLVPGNENDPLYKALLSAFTQALSDLNWTDGRNVRIDLRWTGDDINRIRAFAQELVGLQPDIIVTTGTPATAAVQRETRTIPIHVWWNFVSSRKERIEQAKAEWKARRFDIVPGDEKEFIPLPES